MKFKLSVMVINNRTETKRGVRRYCSGGGGVMSKRSSDTVLKSMGLHEGAPLLRSCSCKLNSVHVRYDNSKIRKRILKEYNMGNKFRQKE
jgi:hypothetical protein